MKKFTVSLLFSIACLLSAPLAFGQVNGAVIGNNTGNNTTYRDVRMVGPFSFIVPSSNKFVLSNIIATATQSNMQNSYIEVPTRSIFSLGKSTASIDNLSTGRVYVQIAGSIDGSFFKTNVYSVSNALALTNIYVGTFQDVDTNLIYRYLAINQINSLTTNNTTNLFYWQFRPAQ